jgi:hypothetical protein
VVELVLLESALTLTVQQDLLLLPKVRHFGSITTFALHLAWHQLQVGQELDLVNWDRLPEEL